MPACGGCRPRMSTTLSGCRVDELDVVVTVNVVVRVGRLGFGSARAGARAGPVEPVQ